jgi:hypothetical protein
MTAKGTTELDDQALLGIVGGGSMYGGDPGSPPAARFSVHGPDAPDAGASHIHQPIIPQTAGHAPSGQSSHAVPVITAVSSAAPAARWHPERALEVDAAEATDSPLPPQAPPPPPAADKPPHDHSWEAAHERFHAALDEVHEGVHQIIEGAAEIAHAMVEMLPGAGHFHHHGADTTPPSSPTPAAMLTPRAALMPRRR